MICTKVAIIRGIFDLFTEYFRRITDLFTGFALLFFFFTLFLLYQQ